MASSRIGRLRNIAHRVKGRLGGTAAAVGDGFGPQRGLALAVLEEEGDSAFARAGASLVGAWEVGITDLARALEPRMQTSAKNKLTERVSDALVPTQQPLQDAKQAFSSAVKKGTQAGLKSGRLADAVAPSVAIMGGLGDAIGAGWVKSSDYLGPLWEALPGDDNKERYLALGPRLQTLLDEQAAVFASSMAALPQRSELEPAIREAMDEWYGKVSLGIEIIVYDGRTIMVEAARELPLKAES